MAEELSRLLERGSDTIVRTWTEKVLSDKRVCSDSQLTYAQLLDHIPQIVEELSCALADEQRDVKTLKEGRQHGRTRWHQGYDLKEVVRELTLLRATVMEFIASYGGAMRPQSAQQLSKSFHRINSFMDEELYKTIEAYLESSHDSHRIEGMRAEG
jgi:RsbT co-antagonist protein rsbRD N-terminal domain